MALGPGAASRGGGRRRVLPSHADQAGFYRLPTRAAEARWSVGKRVWYLHDRELGLCVVGVLSVERRVRDYKRIWSTGSSRPH